MADYSNLWIEMREELLREPDGDAVIDGRVSGLPRWLRECRDDPACSVARAAEHVRAAPASRLRRSEGAWRDFFRESGDLREGETEAEASRRIAAGSVEHLPSRLDEFI